MSQVLLSYLCSGVFLKVSKIKLRHLPSSRMIYKQSFKSFSILTLHFAMSCSERGIGMSYSQIKTFDLFEQFVISYWHIAYQKDHGLSFFSFFFQSLSFFSFFFKWAPSTPNSTIGHVSIFSTQVDIFVPLILLQTLVHFYLLSHPFFSNQIFVQYHASNAIILRKSESFIF